MTPQMSPEERLDALLAARLRGERITPTPQERDAIAVAESMADLQSIPVPATFASGLEARLRARASDIARAEDEGQETIILEHAPFPLPPAPRRRRLLSRPAWVAAAIAAAVIMALSVTLVSASANSLPGDPLYGLRSLGNELALSRASGPADHARVALQQLHGAITDLHAEIANERSGSDISAAFGVVRHATSTAQDAVRAVPTGADAAAMQSQLATELTYERATLHQGLLFIPFDAQVDFTTQLGALGETVPFITSVVLARTGDEAVILTITGANFQAGALVIVDGQLVSATPQVTATQITVQISGEGWSDGGHVVGLRNPDGTAASAQTQARVPFATPEPDDGGHGTPAPGDDGGGGKGTPTGTPGVTPSPDH